MFRGRKDHGFGAPLLRRSSGSRRPMKQAPWVAILCVFVAVSSSGADMHVPKGWRLPAKAEACGSVCRARHRQVRPAEFATPEG